MIIYTKHDYVFLYLFIIAFVEMYQRLSSLFMYFCNFVVFDISIGGGLMFKLTSDDSIVGSLNNSTIKLDDVPVAKDTEDFCLRKKKKR